jgi:GAF domain-containing protein
VTPLFDSAGRLVGVLDVDSSEPNAFDMLDARGLEAICRDLLSTP